MKDVVLVVSGVMYHLVSKIHKDSSQDNRTKIRWIQMDFSEIDVHVCYIAYRKYNCLSCYDLCCTLFRVDNAGASY